MAILNNNTSKISIEGVYNVFVIRQRFIMEDSVDNTAANVLVCDIPFGSWAYDVTQLDIRPERSNVNVSDFNDLGEFTIGNIASRTSLKLANDGRAFRVVHTTVILKRKQQLYIICYLIPCILIDLMMVISFIIPYQHGVQKIIMGVTLFLTGIVYLQSLIKTLPATTDQQILLSEYYLSMLMVLSSGTLLNVVSLIVAHSGRNGKREVPCLLRKVFCIDSSCQNVGKGRQTASFEGKLTNHSAIRLRRQSVESTREHTPLEYTLVNIEAITEGISDTLLKQERSDSNTARVDGEWKIVAKVLDRFFLIGYLIEIIVVNSYTVHKAHDYVDSYASFDNPDSWNIM
ncbi:neuronal acetylcholine receptor subunit alpha-9-like [Ptychodera flava]|uniref:neuronal acetylcholine receptor subunit alpha-9-like n=1 Tax=Ptychodera flava TaxID=63121 RepID=UPI00396A73C2